MSSVLRAAAVISFVIAVISMGKGASATLARQAVSVRFSSCDGKPISNATATLHRAETVAHYEAIKSTFRALPQNDGVLSVLIEPGYYDIGVKTAACDGGVRFAVLPGFNRDVLVELRERPKPHGIAHATLWGPTLGVAGSLPRGVSKVTLYSVTRGSYGGPRPVYVDRGAYYADRIGPDKYILVLQGLDGRVSQLALDVSDDAYTFQRRDISNNEFRSALGVPASPYHRPEKIVAGLDGNMWFLDPNGDNVGKVSSNGGVTIFRLPSFASAPTAIAAGTDSVWVTETATDTIARVGYDGVVREYRLPMRSGKLGHGRLLENINRGADDRMWFSERAQPYLGAIDDHGVITEYPIGSGEYGTLCLVRGSDGRQWFGGIKVFGAMDATGRVMLLPSASWVQSMVPARDGVWADNGDITHVAPDGKETSYKVPLGDSSPMIMVEGSKGALWFVDQHGDTLGSVDSTGKVSQSYIKVFWPARVRDIVVDGEGRLWVAEPNQNTISSAGGLYFPPHRSDPTFLAASNSGDMWFTSPVGGDVGVVRKSGEVQCFSVDPGSRHDGCTPNQIDSVGSTALP